MRSRIPTTEWNLTYLVNLVILGLLINSFQDLLLPTYDSDTIVLGLSISNPSRVH